MNETGLPEKHIVGLRVDHNFWVQGPGIEEVVRYRKCGPHTEVFYDQGARLTCGPDCLPGCRCGRFVEFANTLFIGTEIDIETARLRPMVFSTCAWGEQKTLQLAEGSNA